MYATPIPSISCLRCGSPQERAAPARGGRGPGGSWGGRRVRAGCPCAAWHGAASDPFAPATGFPRGAPARSPCGRGALHSGLLTARGPPDGGPTMSDAPEEEAALARLLLEARGGSGAALGRLL